MRISSTLATAACLLWAANSANSAVAQYGPTRGPALLALPDTTPIPEQYPLHAAPPSSRPVAAGYGAPRESAAYTPARAGGYEVSAYGSTATSVWNEQPEAVAVPEPAPGSIAAPGGAPSPFHEALGAECADCVSGCAGVAAGCSRWYGSVGGLIMTRDRPNKFWTTFDNTNVERQLLFFPEADWGGGGEVRIGRRFGCGCNFGLEGVYWGLGTLEGESSVRSTANILNTTIDVGNVFIGADPVASFFDNAREHRLTRRDEIHNVEMNLVTQPFVMPGSAQRLQLAWLMGARWLRFDDRLSFGAVAGGSEFGAGGGIDEAYLNTRVENDLVGFQVGTRADLWVTQRLRLLVRPTFGVFGNDIDLRTRLFRGDGLVGFDLNSSKHDVALLGQIDTGVAWQITPRWSAFGLYRAVGISGVALGDNQFTPFLADTAGLLDVDSNGSLILHGAVIGAQFNF